MFEELKKELKKFGFKGFLATISYLFAIGFVGLILAEIASLGGWGYVISFIGILYFFYNLNWLSGTRILETLRQGWLMAPVYFHLLVIFDALIWSIFLHHLSEVINKPFNKPLWIIKKTFGR